MPVYRIGSNIIRLAGGGGLFKIDDGIGTPEDVSRLMISGHSLSSAPQEGFGEMIADSKGVDMQWWQTHADAGASIAFRTGDEPTWTGFNTGSVRVQTGNITNARNMLDEWTTPETPAGAKYTHLLITENHNIIGSLQFSDTLRRFMVYYNAFMERSQGAKVYFWSPWYGPPLTPSNVRSWIAYEKAAQKVWDGLISRMNLTLANRAQSDRVLSAPASYVLAHCVEDTLDGEAPGISEASDAASMAHWFNGDDIHVYGAVGHYFLAIMEFCVVYRRDPLGAWYPTDAYTPPGRPGPTWPGGHSSSITATQANTVQTLVWKYLKQYHSVDQWAPTMPQMQTYMIDTFEDIWNSHLGETDNFAPFFGDDSYSDFGNPFYFDAATDESLGLWWDGP